MRKSILAGLAVTGAALAGGAIYLMRENQTEEPDFRALKSDGDFQIRDYRGIVVAETIVEGERRAALSEGFRILADYIFAKSRDGETLPMTVPVLHGSGDPMASDPPLFDDSLEGAWRVRFVMPNGRTADDLPDPPEGITLVEVEPRRVGVVRFAGSPSDDQLSTEEDRLRGWLRRQGETPAAEPEYAFYNSPMIPPPLRRNEVWLAIDHE